MSDSTIRIGRHRVPIVSSPPSGTPSYNAIIAALNPTIWFKFNESSGNLINYGSYATNATVTGSPTYQVAGGPLGVGIRLDASPEKFTMADNASQDIPVFTWVFTFKHFGNALSGSGADGRMYQWGVPSLLVQNDRSLKWEIRTVSGNVSVTGSADQIGTSFPSDHLTAVLVHDGTNMNMYTFGESVPFVTNTTPQANALVAHGGVLVLGNNTGNTRQADILFNGVVRIPAALTLQQAQQLQTAIYG